MKKSDDEVLSYWKIILEKFSSYNGTVISFCKENEIGKANIYIPADEILLLSTVLKELAKSC